MAGTIYGSLADSSVLFRDGNGQLQYQFASVGSNGGITFAAPWTILADPDTGTRFGSGNPIPVAPKAIAPQSSTGLEASHAFNASSGVPGPCDLLAFHANAVGQSGWVLLYDAVAPPADGNVRPLKAWPMQANTYLDWQGYPIKLLVGCVLVFSSDGPLFQTSVNAALFSAEVR